VIVAAHQPHFLPWIGYLAKVAACDLFVVMDDLQYEAQNFQNRNRVKINHGALWLTVPLVRGAQQERICDKRIDNRAPGARCAFTTGARPTGRASRPSWPRC
jgi:WbqC-like protein family